MSEMQERVARALLQKAIELDEVDAISWEHAKAPDKAFALHLAGAAIQAMREPTDLMLAYRSALLSHEDALGMWHEMIDAALIQS